MVMTGLARKSERGSGKDGDTFTVTHFIYSNFRRQKLRYGLTTFGVTVCIIFFIVVASLSLGLAEKLEGDDDKEPSPDDEKTSLDKPRDEVRDISQDVEGSVVGWLYLTAVLIFASAIAIVSNTLFMSISERRKEIGVLKALGISNAQVYRIFFLESLMISLVALLIGIFAGAHLANNIFNSIYEKGGSGIFFAPTTTPPVIIFVTFLLSMGVAGIAALYPARMAAKMTPVEALRD